MTVERASGIAPTKPVRQCLTDCEQLTRTHRQTRKEARSVGAGEVMAIMESWAPMKNGETP